MTEIREKYRIKPNEIQLEVGEAEGLPFILPPETVTQTFAILAKRGVGKTYCASVMTEEMLKSRLHVCVVDPVGVWWGLRSSADGEGPGLPVIIFGGDHGDVPLEETQGEIIADLIIQERLPALLDLSHMRKNKQVKFMTDFAERLYYKNRQPLHLMLDEADAFAPQRTVKGQGARLLGAIEDLVRRGRARGLGITLITQRPAVINKNVLTQAEVLVALRTIAPQDRDAVDAWVKFHGTPEEREQLMASLPSLPVGTAWFWSPGWLKVFERVKVRTRETFDSSATPEVGQQVITPRQLAEVDIAKLRDQLATTIEKAKANDPRELRRQIAELEKQLKAKTSAKVETRVERVEVPVLEDKKVKQLEQEIAQLSQASANILEIGQQLTGSVEELKTALAQAQTPTPKAVVRPKPKIQTRPRPTAPPPGNGSSDVQLKKGERTMLSVLGQHHPDNLTRIQLATLSGYSVNGGTFSSYLSTLRKNNLIVDSNGQFSITRAGLDWLGPDLAPSPQTTEDILEIWKSTLKLGERKMIDALVEVYPHQLSRVELAERAGYEVTGGTFSSYLSTLRRNGLAQVDGDMVQASETLFLG